MYLLSCGCWQLSAREFDEIVTKGGDCVTVGTSCPRCMDLRGRVIERHLSERDAVARIQLDFFANSPLPPRQTPFLPSSPHLGPWEADDLPF